MPHPADRFQMKTYVRLPYSDAFLYGRDVRRFNRELKRAFGSPILTVRIVQREPRSVAQSLALPQSETTM